MEAGLWWGEHHHVSETIGLWDRNGRSIFRHGSKNSCLVMVSLNLVRTSIKTQGPPPVVRIHSHGVPRWWPIIQLRFNCMNPADFWRLSTFHVFTSSMASTMILGKKIRAKMHAHTQVTQVIVVFFTSYKLRCRAALWEVVRFLLLVWACSLHGITCMFGYMWVFFDGDLPFRETLALQQPRGFFSLRALFAWS